jgi:hypothetical protein
MSVFKIVALDSDLPIDVAYAEFEDVLSVATGLVQKHLGQDKMYAPDYRLNDQGAYRWDDPHEDFAIEVRPNA